MRRRTQEPWPPARCLPCAAHGQLALPAQCHPGLQPHNSSMLLHFCSSDGFLQHVCNPRPVFNRDISRLPTEFGAATKLLVAFKSNCASRKALALVSHASAHLLRQGPGASLQHPAGGQSAPGQPAAAQLHDTGTPAGHQAMLEQLRLCTSSNRAPHSRLVPDACQALVP